MGSDRLKPSMFSPVVCQRLKLCMAFVSVMGVLVALAFFLNDGKGLHNQNSSSSDASTATATLSSISEYVSTNIVNPNKLVTSMNPNNFVWHNKYDLVHVIETDFLQYQLDLVHMNQARLGLFETFTVPSMKQQSNKEFLWLIWTDPALAGDFKKQLVNLVSDMPNAVVLGYSRNKKIDFRELNGLLEEDIDEALVAGSKKLLLDYYKASQDRVMIETRLDADDAFNKEFIEVIQVDAANTIAKSDLKSDYRIFCPEHHTEWRYYKPNEHENPEGHLVHYHNPSFCINTGLTIGYQIDARSRHLQTLEQCNMNTWYEDCKAQGYDGVDSYNIEGTPYLRHYCVMHTTTRDHPVHPDHPNKNPNKNPVHPDHPNNNHNNNPNNKPNPNNPNTPNNHLKGKKQESVVRGRETQDVLMSRTPTAAGMKRVLGTEASFKSTFESLSAQRDAWAMMEKDFGVKKDKVVALRRQMELDIENILRDALEGQCTPGHSCKASTKRKLMKLLHDVKENAQKDIQN